ncbi:MAG TPA: DUF4380 domain-containing protein [Armatimonadota bacterium]|nr:DUF4380 domain-containing protein [Armatimonadota bacterium]
MKNSLLSRTAVYLFLILSFAASPVLARKAKPSHGPVVTVSQVNYDGWQGCYRISNGKTQAVIVPDIGGRIMDYSVNGENAIFVNRAEEGKLYPITKIWHNYGGFKDWNSPQSVWGFPPDPYLDFGHATVEILQGQTAPTVRVTGAASLESGLIFTRDITMDPVTGDLTVQQRMYNIAAKPQQWGVWGVTQAPTSCVVAVPINPKSHFAGGVYTFPNPTAGFETQWHAANGLLIMRPDRKVGKLGIDDSAGWMAYFRGKLAYIKRIPTLTPGAAYPDNGSNAEIYVDHDLPYLEMEVLSPLFSLPPGAYGELTEQWQIRMLPHAVKTDADVAAAVKSLGL